MTDHDHRPVGASELRPCCDEPVPAELMEIYVACDDGDGDTDRLVAELRGFGDANAPT